MISLHDLVAFLFSVIARIVNFIRRAGRWVERRELEYRLVARCASCGSGLSIKGRCIFTGISMLNLGENVHIGEDAFVRAEGGLDIGDNTHISRRVTIYTINHEYEGLRLPYDETVRERRVSIGRNVWIGMNVTILPGAVISDGAIIGAGAVVGGKVEPLSIYCAPRAIAVGSRDAKHYEQLDDAGEYGGANGVMYKRKKSGGVFG